MDRLDDKRIELDWIRHSTRAASGKSSILSYPSSLDFPTTWVSDSGPTRSPLVISWLVGIFLGHRIGEPISTRCDSCDTRAFTSWFGPVFISRLLHGT